MPRRRAPSRNIKINPDILATPQERYFTEAEIRELYGPPRTLGKGAEERRLAMDSALQDSGVYSLLQHAIASGALPYGSFMGYGALQLIAQNGLVRACVSTVSDDMTRNWIKLTHVGEDEVELVEDTEDGELVPDLLAALENLQIQAVCHEALDYVGYEGGAFIFIDTGAKGADLALPLCVDEMSEELKPHRRLRFVVVDPVNVTPGLYDTLQPLSPSYMRPDTWLVLGQVVHSSRLLRLVANEVPTLLKPTYNFLGIPQAQILWDYVQHFSECRAAAARLLTKFSMTVFKTKTLSGMLFDGSNSTQLDRRIAYAIQNMSNDGIFAIDKDAEDVVKLETPISGVTDVVRQALEFLAAINRTPAVKLLGISPSGFNATGESDIRNYYDHIASMQEKVLRAPIKKILDCIQLHIRGKIDPSLRFEFEPLGEEDKALQATTQKTIADTAAVYLDRDVVSTEEVRRMLADLPESGFANIDPEDVPEFGGMPDLLGEQDETEPRLLPFGPQVQEG